MTTMTYHSDITGLVVIDPYNDFISPGGKVWDPLSSDTTSRWSKMRQQTTSTPTCTPLWRSTFRTRPPLLSRRMKSSPLFEVSKKQEQVRKAAITVLNP
jgi:hypothetical protein